MAISNSTTHKFSSRDRLRKNPSAQRAGCVLGLLAIISFSFGCSGATGASISSRASFSPFSPSSPSSHVSPSSPLPSPPSSPSSPSSPSTSASGLYDGPAELPLVSVSSSLADTPATGGTWSVNSSDNLQQALTQAHCGDTILLQAGVTFTGNFVLPDKNCDDQHWIVLRSSASESQLPPEGARITPCYAGVSSLPGRPSYPCPSSPGGMAKLVAAYGMPSLRFEGGANHYRIGPGLEITRPIGTGMYPALIGHQEPITQNITNVVIDRDWIHGTATDETMRGINLDGMTYAAVVDSYINDFHCITLIGACVDAQAIVGGNGFLPEGPWKIEDNFLEGSAENILLGGSGGSIVPTDITIQHNHFFKPLIWMPGYPGFVGAPNSNPQKCTSTPGYCPFIVKNLLEFKNAQRVLLDGNIMENNWAGFSQNGGSILLTAVNQGEITGNPNATVADITIRYSHISHTAKGLAIANTALGNQGPAKMAARFSIHDDLFDDISPAYANGDTTAIGVAFQFEYCPVCSALNNVFVNHVTMLLQAPTALMLLGAPSNAPIENLTFTNNIVSVPTGMAIFDVGPKLPCVGTANTNQSRLSACLNPYLFAANALIGGAGVWPEGNFFPANHALVDFVGSSTLGGYALSPNSPYQNVGTDGTVLGADINAIDSATEGVE
jgi:hypothetical protein